MKGAVAMLILLVAGCGSSSINRPLDDGGVGDKGLPETRAEAARQDGAGDLGPRGGPKELVSEPEILDVAGPETGEKPEVAEDLPADLPEELVPETRQQVDTEPELPVQGVGPLCFPSVYDPNEKGPDYDQFQPLIGSHCYGTNHQVISGVKEVVFLGDSVTVGTPNIAHLLSVDNSHFHRNLLAEWLANHYGLKTGNLWDWGVWKTYDYFTGKGGDMQVGDFRHCGKWGARTDDLLSGGGQVHECFPSGGHPEPTLFIISLGGNDIARITEKGAEASPEEVAAGYPEAWALAESAVGYLEEAIVYIKDPVNFPGGSFVVYCNGFEFTDATGQTSACTPQFELDIPYIGTVDLSELAIPVALLAGYGEWEQPEVQADIVIWMLEQYMRIAVEYQADMIWTIESFCGHGYVAAGANADPDNVCYLGPDSPLYFDETCVHPSEAGHFALYQMYRAVVEE